jgi:hypothetical protein
MRKTAIAVELRLGDTGLLKIELIPDGRTASQSTTRWAQQTTAYCEKMKS